MTHTAIKAVAAIGIIGAVAVGGPYLIGQQIESDFRAAIAAAPDHYPYPITLVSYQRGLFSSVAETRQVIDIGPDSDDITIDDEGNPVIPPNRLIPVSFHHEIGHGPRLDGLRLTRFVNTLKFEGDALAAVRRIFGDSEPATLTVDVGFGGDISGSLVSPAVDTPLPAGEDSEGGRLQWSGLTSDFSVRGKHVVGALDAPGLNFGDGKVVMGPVTAKADMTIVTDGVWIGNFNNTFASMSVAEPNFAFSMKDIRIDSDTTDTAGQLKSGATFAIKEMLFNDVRVDDTRMRLVLDRLDTQAMSAFSRALNRFTAEQGGKTAGVEELPQMLAVMKPSLAAAAAGQPLFAIEELSFTAPQGKVRMEGRVQYVGDADIEDFAVATDVVASAKVEAPMPLIELLLQLQTAKTVIPGPDGAPVRLSPEQIAATTQASRDGMVAQGLLIVDGDRARSEIEFKGGALTVNGKALGAPAI